MSKADRAIVECADEALSSFSYIDKDSFYGKLEREYGVKREQIAQKYEQFHFALRKEFGDKHYAIERQIVRTLHNRAQIGVYNRYDEIDAFAKVSDFLMRETEVQLTKNEARLSLYDYAKHMQRLVEESKEQLKASERMAAIGQTAGMVGHDIRNPLQAIIGDLYVLKSDIDQLPNGEAKQSMVETLDAINVNIDYINKIVADLQDFAKPLKPEPVRVDDLCKVIGQLLSTINVPSSIKAELNCAKNMPVLSLDLTFLKRILVNLATNAIQAMPLGGVLTVDAFQEEGKVLIVVEDTGVGIPEHLKPKLFTPLLTTKSKGQGLGLPVVKRYTEALGGAISFESQEGKGTKFIVSLPIPKVK